MYTQVEKFISSGWMYHLITYDMKNESPWNEVCGERKPIEKFLLYRQYNKNRFESQIFDCDNSNGTCTLMNDVYQKLWGWSYADRFTIPNCLIQQNVLPWDRLGADTMNSFATSYNMARRLYHNDNNVIKKNRQLVNFATLTHSIGNFTLVPYKLNPQSDRTTFNSARGYSADGNSAYFVYDYFDLSLKLIKENISIDAFKQYIDTFYLNDYVDSKYNIIPLMKCHKAFLKQEKMDLRNPQKFLPKTEEELNEFLTNVNRRIIARGRRMCRELKKKIREQ